MHKEVLRAMEGIGLYGAISLIIFVLFFISVFLWVLRMKRGDAEKLAAMPLDDGEKPTPLQGVDPHG